MRYEGHDKGVGRIVTSRVLKAHLRFDHRKSATEKDAVCRPRECRQIHHLPAGVQALTKKSHEAL